MVDASGTPKQASAEPLSIEPMMWEDLDEVVELERVCFTHPWTRRMFEEDLAQVSSTYYIVARLSGMIVGYAGAWIIGGEAHITTLAVHPKFRRRGIGETLLHALLEEAARRGAVWAKLEVRRSNFAAQRLYEKWGFRVVGLQLEYYTNPREDALILELSDIKSALKRWREHNERIRQSGARIGVNQ